MIKWEQAPYSTYTTYYTYDPINYKSAYISLINKIYYIGFTDGSFADNQMRNNFSKYYTFEQQSLEEAKIIVEKYIKLLTFL